MLYKVINVKILRPTNPEIGGMSTHLLGIDLWIPERMQGLYGDELAEGLLVEKSQRNTGPHSYRLIRTEVTPDSPYPHFSAVPLESEEEMPHWFRGNYIWSNEIEFRDICGYPIEVHD